MPPIVSRQSVTPAWAKMNQAKNFPRPSAIPKAFGLEAAAHQSAEPQFLHFLAHPLDQKDAGGVVAGRMLWLPNALLDLPLRKEWGSADSQAIARPENQGNRKVSR